MTLCSQQWHAPTRIVLPGGLTQEYTYDAFMRLTRLQSKDSAGRMEPNEPVESVIVFTEGYYER
jgi:YD repeat-containing protein